MSEKVSKRSFVRSVSKVGSWTFASRILGLVRDSVIARIFGVGFATDAFMIAFTIPNLLRRLLAEGALSVAFVPVFTDAYVRRPRGEFERTFQVIFGAFSVLVIGVSVLGMGLAPLVVKLFAPGFDHEKFELTTQLTRVMFPFIFFMGSSSVVMGVLNAMKSFSVPAAAPLLLNLSIILCAVFLSDLMHPPIVSVAAGVLLGGLAQWALQLGRLRTLKVALRPRFEWAHPALRRILKLIAGAVFGVAVYHLNVLVSRALASALPQGSVTYLYYSDRFLEFPLGIFAVSIATVALPHLARQACESDRGRLGQTLLFSLRLVLFVCIPAMVGLVVLRVPILSLVFQHGKFTDQNTLDLAQVFLMASLGLCAVAGLRVTVQAFYSLGDVRTPVRAAFASFVLNAVLGFILMQGMGASGLTLASSVAAWLQWGLLFVFLGKRLGKFSLRPFFREISPMLLSALVMALAVWPLSLFHERFMTQSFSLRLFFLLGGIGAGVFIYLLVAYLLGVKELRILIQKLTERFKKPGAVEDTEAASL